MRDSWKNNRLLSVMLGRVRKVYIPSIFVALFIFHFRINVLSYFRLYEKNRKIKKFVDSSLVNLFYYYTI